MAKATTKSSRGRKQDRARVAGGQDYEVSYTAKKTKRSAASARRLRSAVAESGSSGGSDARDRNDLRHCAD